MIKNIYLFSGLGADYRAFQFLDLSPHNLIHIEWIKPEKKESLELYAKSLAKQITHNNPILIGLSFGGMIAIEVAKYVAPEKTILISSFKSKEEIPLAFRFTGLLGLHKIMSPKFLQKPNKVLYWLFGTTNEKEEALLNVIIQDTDPEFMQWAIDKVIHWSNTVAPKNLTHIHGTDDRILPHHKMHNITTIPGGGHFMIVNKAKEVNKIIQEILYG
jgi:pimeloyl-ACP methyl ester carboxylesterase